MSKKNNPQGENELQSNSVQIAETSQTLNNTENATDSAENISDKFLQEEPVENEVSDEDSVSNSKHESVEEAAKRVNRELNIDSSAQSNKSKKSRKRQQPRRMGEKLRRIRQYYGLSQGSMLQLINPYEDDNARARISQYESGKRAPSHTEMLNYARFANVAVEAIIDDNMDLPKGF